MNQINTTNLRDLEGYMTQETHLFHDSIRNNLRIAKLDATEEEIVAACKKASVHDFIMSLPEGYDSQIGELGSTVSGGEKQRLGLARMGYVKNVRNFAIMPHFEVTNAHSWKRRHSVPIVRYIAISRR